MENIPKIIFEDESLLVIDKPSGWITNSASTAKGQPVVQEWLAENFQFPIFNFQELRNGIVHRLDKETSGILLVAKTPEVFEYLQRQFKERKVEKRYTALVHGRVKLDSGEINAPVGRLPWRRDRFGVLAGGRDAETGYKVTRCYETKSGNYSLVEFFPKTGRTHQIRIHAKYIGHPLVSDEFYAGRKTARKDRARCPRLFLHASFIKFIHPKTGKPVEFESGLNSNLVSVLKKL
ncbi:MAG: RluA family pseudouridine synthase [bacterium]|nr:RluA family pseudouridine synthase [bacterium]